MCMENLKNALKSIVPSLSKSDLDSKFPVIAELLMSNYGVETQGQIYFFNEVEFYYYDPLYNDLTSSSKHRITYDRNALAGCWLIHSYGVDLTFTSNKDEGYGGGILIRSIEASGSQKAVVGPVKCVEALWEESVDAFISTAPNPKIIKIPKRDIELDVPTKRIKIDSENKWRFTIKGKNVCELK